MAISIEKWNWKSLFENQMGKIKMSNHHVYKSKSYIQSEHKGRIKLIQVIWHYRA